MIQRRRQLMEMQSGLPGIYQAVEYLTSTGTQYFWTDIDIQDGITVDSIQSIPSSGSDSYLFGGSTGIQQTCFNGAYNGAFQAGYPTGYYLINGFYSYGVTCRVTTTHVDGKRIVYKDGNLYMNTAPVGDAIVQNGTKFVCFGSRKSDGTVFQIFKGNVYRIKVSKNNEMLADYVPCVRKSDNKPGMYDLVLCKFYTNAGIGEFIVPQ